jgi:hypothetical protein
MERSSRFMVMAEVMAGAITVAEVIITAGVEAVATTMAGHGAVTTVGCEKTADLNRAFIERPLSFCPGVLLICRLSR